MSSRAQHRVSYRSMAMLTVSPAMRRAGLTVSPTMWRATAVCLIATGNGFDKEPHM